MALVKYWNGIPTRHVTTLLGAGQQTDFDEELLPQSQDNCLIMKPDGFVLKQGSEILSGFGHHGFRPKRYVFQLSMQQAGGAATPVQFIADVDGTRITLTIKGFTATSSTSFFTNVDVLIPAKLCPVAAIGTIVFSLPIQTAAATYSIGGATLTAGGVLSIYSSAAFPANFAAGPAVVGVLSCSVTYDTAAYV